MMKCVFAHDHPFIFDGHSYYSRAGFPPKVLKRYLEAFGELEVICRAVNASADRLEPHDDRRVKFSPQVNLRSLSGLKKYHRVRQAVREIIKHADVVVARLPSFLGWLAAREARLLKVPYLIEVVGNALESNRLHGSALGVLTGPIEHYLTKNEVRNAGLVVYITKNYLQSVYPSSGITFVCPNVQVEQAPESILLERLKKVKGNGVSKLGLIGSLDVNYKGHDVALRVMAVLVNNFSLSDLVIEFIGGGSAERWLRLASDLGIQKNVRFLGSLAAGNPVLRWLDQIDILLQPSRTEAQGRSIIEGMSRGCPVIASNVGGIPELLDSEYICAPDDFDFMVNKCKGLIDDFSAYEKQSRRNWCVSAEYSVSTVESQRLAAFEVLRRRVQ